MPVPYYHVDSFTAELFAGNPAGVCVVPAFPAAGIMQKIAAENRQSQTAFVVQRGDGDCDLRWSAPATEDDLCGHATLAAAFVLALRGHAHWPVRFHTRSGMLSVVRKRDMFEMDFPAWPAKACEPPPDLLPALGIKTAPVLKARDYFVVLERAEQVRTLSPDIRRLAKIEMGTGAVVATAGGEGDADYVCRCFAPSVGIDEDPATGSIHCILAPYWAGRLGKQSFRVRQLSPRGASILTAVAGDRVKIAGTARLYLQGVIEL